MVYERPSGWPEACEIIAEAKPCDIVFVCEHASNYIPEEFGNLGLTPADTLRHIAWDVGAAQLTRRLASQMGAQAFLGTYSRLLLDLNRPLGSPDSIPVISEGTAIPGNQSLSKDAVALRERFIFMPFHDEVADYLDQRQKAGRNTKIVTIHSFTPVYLGVQRPWHIGILHGASRSYATDILSNLRGDSSLNVTLNQPYVISRDGDYALPVHGDDRDIEAVLIEIRNDLLATEEAVDRMAGLLGSALSPVQPFEAGRSNSDAPLEQDMLP
ncbi:N-formylglutamate amidohydrolase [Rhizobium bangladeshense]|uniref:N-formylglutamate amidohydrolase n=1 Tax=Rhizobium bangladeshense TaxID=1138189 RepID=UPI0007E5B33F|nr:N-formylglutamate amidohydrolase [Rhizobium bangladeshense]